ncbi:hypothetical protein [Thalassobacillus hwangdonensis]|uniref:Uncharacterized protein n=1 Tax=Thalassobacillus hwangdonensis TaxID=546108 RepID=A0ABW3KY28_9BACI
MAVLHQASYQALKEVVAEKIASTLLSMRKGKLHITAGGGGTYGKIVD